uniref:ABC transporter permease n=1 Tax=Chlorobium chlorochromatii (strain CaD3) TaxID=340177 RepID=Q3AS42_CHLCH
MKLLWYLATRFALKQRSSSKPTFVVVLAVAGIAAGTAALLLTLAIVNGFAATISQKLVSFNAHLQLRHSSQEFFQEERSERLQLTSHPEITHFTPFLEQRFVLRCRNSAQQGRWSSKAVLVKAMPSAERQNFIKRYSVRGEEKECRVAEGMVGIYLGRSLAEELNCKVGQKVMLIRDSNQASQRLLADATSLPELLASLAIEPAVVCGIYSTGLQEGFDDYLLLADLSALEQSRKGFISGYEANVRHIERLPTTVQELTALTNNRLYGYTLFQRYANLFEWIKLQQNIMPLLIVTITVVAVFNIMATLLVLIIEKTGEIGMLSALGLAPQRIQGLFMLQALLLSITGITLGNLLALGLALFEQHYHLIRLPEKSYFITEVQLLLNPMDNVVVSLSVLALCLLFAWLPSTIAASLKPARALDA